MSANQPLKAKVSIQEIAQDPEFQGLSAADQKLVLGKADPEFASLSGDDQGIVLSSLLSSLSEGLQTKAPQPSKPVNFGQGLQNLGGAIGGGITDTFKALPQAIPNMVGQAGNAIKTQAVNTFTGPLQGNSPVIDSSLATLAGVLNAGRSIGQGLYNLPGELQNAWQGQQVVQPTQLPQLPKTLSDALNRMPVSGFIGEQLPYAIPVLRAGKAIEAASGVQNLARAAAEGATIGAAQDPGQNGLRGRVSQTVFGATAPVALGALGGTIGRGGGKPNLKVVPPEPLPVAKSVPVAAGPVERGFVGTVKESANTAPKVAQEVKGSYTPITNKETLANAQKAIDENLDEAIRRVKEEEQPSAETYAIGQDLVRRYQNEGRFEDAIDLVETMAAKATKQGQAIQALSMWNRLTPEGALKAAERLARKGGKKLDPELAKKITKKAKELESTPEGKRNTDKSAELVKLISEASPVTLGEQLSSIQALAQLLNPKTTIRNMVGNAAFNAAESGSDILAASLDYVLSKFTGKRTKSMPQIGAAATGFKRGAKAGISDALKGVDTNPANNKFDIPKRKVFKNKILRGMETVLDLTLKAPDRAFYMAAYRESLLNQVKALKGPRKRITPEMVTIAHHDALYRTFQDENLATKFFKGTKENFNRFGIKGFGLGELVLKYPKTPANLLMRALDYSPAGFLKAIYEATAPLLTDKQFNQRKFVETFSRTMVGSGSTVGAGYYLAKLGLMTGEANEDKDINAAQKLQGTGAFKVNITGLLRYTLAAGNPNAAKPRSGDLFASYDWLQPMAVGFAMGANIAQNEGSKKEKELIDQFGAFAGDLVGALNKGTETLADQPLLQGVKTLFGDRENIATGLTKVVTGLPSSFIPTSLSQINQLGDNTARETYDPNLLVQGINQAKAKIPGLAQTLPARIDPYGQVQERYQDGGNNLVNVLLNPAFVSRFKDDPVAQEVLGMYQRSGETQQAPRLVPRKVKINGENIKLNAEQMGQWQQYVGQRTKDLFDMTLQIPQFQAMSDATKADTLSSIMTSVNEAAKIELFGEKPLKRPSQLAIAVMENNPYKQEGLLMREVFMKTLNARKQQIRAANR